MLELEDAGVAGPSPAGCRSGEENYHKPLKQNLMISQC